MLWTSSTVKGYAVSGIDGHLGTVADLLFDDTNWKMRWLVVSTGHWLPDQEVLLPVAALGYPDPARQQFAVTLTMQQIRDCPHVDGDLPVSQQAGVCSPLDQKVARPRTNFAILSASKPNDPHLRSMEAVVGHRVHAIDGLVGHVDDFLIDEVDWTVRFIKVDTRNWGPTRRLLLPPALVRKIDWPSRAVHLDVVRQQIENRSPNDAVARADAENAALLLACGEIRWVNE